MIERFYSETTGRLLFTIFDSSKPRKVNLFSIHRHVALELGYIVNGEGTYHLDDMQYDAKSGDMFLIRTNEQHCIPTIFTPELTSFNIHIEPYFLWNVCTEFIDSQHLHALVNTEVPIKHLFQGQESRIRLLIKLTEHPTQNRFQIKRTVLELLTSLMQEITLEDHSVQSTAVSARLNDIQNAICFIQEHLTDPISLDDIAHAAHMSRASLSSYFKKINGISPYEYLIIKRIEKSLALLKDTDLSILRIAQESGFDNLSNFNRRFKNIKGITPKDYRKSIIRRIGAE